MSLIRFYVRHQLMILPTVAETEAGFYVDAGPVDVFEIQEVDGWRTELYHRVVQGNPLVPTPERSDDPGSAILERLNITKWSTFETSAIMYTIHRGGRYISVYRTGKGPDGMWTQENTNVRQFANQIPLEMLVQLIAEDVLKQPEANRPKTSLMLASSAPLMLAPPAPPTSDKQKLDSSNTDAAKAESPKPDAAKTDSSKPDEPKAESPKTDKGESK